jgi:hypothetical protein
MSAAMRNPLSSRENHQICAFRYLIAMIDLSVSRGYLYNGYADMLLVRDITQ